MYREPPYHNTNRRTENQFEPTRSNTLDCLKGTMAEQDISHSARTPSHHHGGPISDCMDQYAARLLNQKVAASVHTFIFNTNGRKNKTNDRSKWIDGKKKLMQTTWGLMINLWKSRNDERHGWNTKSRNRARCNILHHELADLYNRKSNNSVRVQQLLHDSYETHIQEMITKLANWLDTYRGTFNVTWSSD
jgi:hypothetical protein